MEERTLVTGGAGFIGSALSAELARRGQDVRVLSLVTTASDRENAAALERLGVDVVRGDVADRSLHRRALEGVRVVHHVAAAMREGDLSDHAFHDTNVEATLELALSARASGVERFVYCSTMGVTGDVRGRRVDETEPYDPKDVYTRTKAEAERRLLRMAEQGGGLEIAVVRPTDVYGPNDRRLLKLFRLIQRERFFFLGDGSGKRHMVYIDDLIRGMIAAQSRESARGEVFLLAGPETITLRELAGAAAEALDVAPPRLQLPYRPVRALSALVAAICRPLGIRPPIYPRRVDFFAHDYEFDISKARDLLGYRPEVGVREGVRRTVDDYRRKGWLD